MILSDPSGLGHNYSRMYIMCFITCEFDPIPQASAALNGYQYDMLLCMFIVYIIPALVSFKLFIKGKKTYLFIHCNRMVQNYLFTILFFYIESKKSKLKTFSNNRKKQLGNKKRSMNSQIPQ